MGGVFTDSWLSSRCCTQKEIQKLVWVYCVGGRSLVKIKPLYPDARAAFSCVLWLQFVSNLCSLLTHLFPSCVCEKCFYSKRVHFSFFVFFGSLIYFLAENIPVRQSRSPSKTRRDNLPPHEVKSVAAARQVSRCLSGRDNSWYRSRETWLRPPHCD